MQRQGVLKEYASIWQAVLRAADAAVVAVTGWLAAYVYLGELPHTAGYGLGIVIAILLVPIMFPAFGLYRAWRGQGVNLEIRTLTFAWSAVLAVLAVLAFLTKRGPEFSRGWFLIWFMLGWSALAIERMMLRGTLGLLRQRGFNQRRIVVVRAGSFGIRLAQGLEAAPWTGLRVIAMFCARAGACESSSPDARFWDPKRDFVGLDHLAAFVKQESVDQVWIALPLKEEDCIRQVLHELRHSTVDVHYVPDVSGLQLLNNSITEVAGFPVMNLSCTQMNGVNELIKGAVDRLLALAILILLSPLMLMIAIGVKLSSPGPVLFRQRRLGARGEEINVLKFRSMVLHDEEPGKVTQATKGDSRITRFGAFLRRTSLDELPQFFNVLLGEMSIVGPRPHALEHNEQYKELVAKYMLRHKVKPGITGWAQVNGYRGETDTLEKMAKRVEYDLQYIENWSLWLDFKIMALTIVRGFDDRNAY
jgi:putative colanic acid biosynthesis UDP-glucose lipid carrier transferase